jgi:hypothetical protein
MTTTQEFVEKDAELKSAALKIKSIMYCCGHKNLEESERDFQLLLKELENVAAFSAKRTIEKCYHAVACVDTHSFGNDDVADQFQDEALAAISKLKS